MTTTTTRGTTDAGRWGRAVMTAAGLAGLVLQGSPAAAQGRPDSLRLSCGQAAELVRRSGAVVIGTGPYVYDRFVADQRFCSINETTVPAWLATRDQNRCFAGYQCKPRQDVRPFGFGWD